MKAQRRTVAGNARCSIVRSTAGLPLSESAITTATAMVDVIMRCQPGAYV
jgi:hypothetical protein